MKVEEAAGKRVGPRRGTERHRWARKRSGATN